MPPTLQLCNSHIDYGLPFHYTGAMNYDLTDEEHAAATAVSSLLAGSQERPVEQDEARDYEPIPIKKARVTRETRSPDEVAPTTTTPTPAPPIAEKSVSSKREILPAPFFYYRDFSRERDPDPLTPLTPPGRVPNFPAKMHAILYRHDVSDIIAWMPHGRSWRVLKPREFEERIIPTYFEHSKFSSFVRQANGWGFRRITQGRDRNSYYHELFLRGLPHLCKKMKRPGVAEKGNYDVEHEPDLYKISEVYPLPEKAEDETIMLSCTVTGGPKARMPIYAGGYLSADKVKAIQGENSSLSLVRTAEPLNLSFQNSTSFGSQDSSLHQSVNPLMFFPQAYIKPNAPTSAAVTQVQTPVMGVDAQLAVMNAADRFLYSPLTMGSTESSTTPLPADASPASQFAAGFAAATALGNGHFCSVLGQSFSPAQSDRAS